MRMQTTSLLILEIYCQN